MKTKLMALCLIFLTSLTTSIYGNTENSSEELPQQFEENGVIYEYIYEYVDEEGIREKRNLGISAQVGGGAVLGLTIDYFLTEHINLELSLVAGYLPIVFGIKYYITPQSNLSPYIGLHGTYTIGYMPIGLEYMHESGFTIAVEAGAILMPELNFCFHGCEDYESEKDLKFYPWGGVKIGYHF